MADFKHFSLVAGGDTVEGHQVPDINTGPCVMSMKVWAESVEEAVDVACNVGNQIGFQIEKDIEVHSTDPQQEAGEEPYAYGVRVIPCSQDTKADAVAAEAETLRSE